MEITMSPLIHEQSEKVQPDYALGLGHSDPELERLKMQARFWGDITRQNLESAGLSPGMKVLDIGCGAGDVSMLAAELVGSSGSVLGVDASDVAVKLSQRRAAMEGILHASFKVQDIHSFESDKQFDALIGRFVLMYMPNPAQTLKNLLRHLRPGGLVVFQEIDTSSFRTVPHAQLTEKSMSWVSEAIKQAGDPHTGTKLFSIFTEAGLPEPEMVKTIPMGGATQKAIFDCTAHTVQSLLPAIERLGLATADEVQIETLSERMRDEVSKLSGHVYSTSLVGAWARKP